MSKPKHPRRLKDNEAEATGKMIRGSAQKLNLVAGLIRGKKVETALADLKSALQGEDKDLIKQKVDAMAQASMKLGEALYQSNQGAAAGSSSSGGGSSEGGDGKDNVVDVDFEEVKDDDSKKSA